MNWSDEEALKTLSQRGKPGARLVRGLLWAIVAIFLISVLAFLAGVAGMASLEPAITDLLN